MQVERQLRFPAYRRRHSRWVSLRDHLEATSHSCRDRLPRLGATRNSSETLNIAFQSLATRLVWLPLLISVMPSTCGRRVTKALTVISYRTNRSYPLLV